MNRLTIEDKFNSIRKNGMIAQVQIEPVLKLIDTKYPDNIESIEARDGTRNIVLDYYASGIRIIVERFRIVLIDHVENTQKVFSNVSKGMFALSSLFYQRQRSSQTKVISAIVDRFSGHIEWTSNWCSISIPIDDKNKSVNIVVRNLLTSITLYNNNSESVAAVIGLDNDNLDTIIDRIIQYMYTDDASLPTLYASVGSSNTSSENDISSKGSIQPTRVNLSKNNNVFTIEAVQNILTYLMNINVENCLGTFSDGWKEALSLVMSRLNTLK